MKNSAPLVIVLIGLVTKVAGRDDTMVEFAAGKDMVEAVSTRIDTSCIFQDDKEFLRRLSYVESKDGFDNDTFTSSTHKGIWKMDESMFEMTKSANRDITDAIKTKLQIDWSSISWYDLQTPIYAGLAVRLYLLVTTKDKAIPRDSKEQADYWKAFYNPRGDEQDFISGVSKLQNECADGLADLVFLLDSSASVRNINFKKMLKFLKDIIATLNIGSDENKNTRISVVSFATKIKAEFSLNNYTTLSEYHKAIDDIVYMTGNTATHLALKFLVEKAFETSFGARPQTKGVPKLGIILTDGMSTKRKLTATETKRVHNAGIHMISIGIGSRINYGELNEIASEPKCRHTLLLEGFTELDLIKNLIEKKACQAPINLQSDDGNITSPLPPGGSRYCKIEVSKNGTTIKVFPIDKGEINLYLSRTVYPNPAHYDKRLTADSFHPAVEFLEGLNTSSNVSVFCMLEGDKEVEVNISIGTKPGNQNPCDVLKPCKNGGECKNVLNEDQYQCICPLPYTGKHCENELTELDNCILYNPCLNGATCINSHSSSLGYQCLCPSLYTGVNCDVEVSEGFNCKDKNPCTPENIAGDKFHFPHQIKGMFLQCSEWGNCYEMNCQPGLVWNPDSNTCT